MRGLYKADEMQADFLTMNFVNIIVLASCHLIKCMMLVILSANIYVSGKATVIHGVMS